MASQPIGTAAVVRLFAGFAGFGAGSLNLALSSSLFTEPAESGGSGQVLFAALAGLWGAALIAATVTGLSGGRIPAPALSGVMLLVAGGVHSAAIFLGRGSGSSLNLSHLAALLLTLMIIASLTWLRRKERQKGQPQAPGTNDGGAPAAVARPGRLLLAAFAGAVLVAGIATPGLAASTAGQYAVPHGQHGGPADPTGHQPSHHQR